MPEGLDEAAQQELAALINLVPDLRRLPGPSLFGTVNVALAALATKPPNLALAKSVRGDLNERIHHYDRTAIKFLYHNSPSTNVLLGLASLFPLITMILVVLFKVVPNFKIGGAVAGVDVTVLTLVGVIGLLGGIVSIMFRINSFNASDAGLPIALFFVACSCQPLAWLLRCSSLPSLRLRSYR